MRFDFRFEYSKLQVGLHSVLLYKNCGYVRVCERVGRVYYSDYSDEIFVIRLTLFSWQ